MNESVNRQIDSGGRFGGALGEEFARVEGMIRRGSIQRTPNMRVSHTSAGVLLEPVGIMGGGESVSVIHFIIESVNRDTIVSDDGTLVAKPNSLRGSRAGLQIFPVYAAGDSIYAVQLATTDPTTYADFLDINVDARAWHYQLGVCHNGTMRKLWVASQEGFA